MIRTQDEIRADRAPLAIVPVIETVPETALSATETAETPSAGIRGGSEGPQALTEALRLLRLALHLRQHGEQAPGGDETWTDWHRQAETLLRAADVTGTDQSPKEA